MPYLFVSRYLPIYDSKLSGGKRKSNSEQTAENVFRINAVR